ncbi:MAG TPA: hypothetical protein VFT22_31245 [Kofleriaceae bacterium]|nr:hypothetical protein [Kofleriaceae bacterium]
MRRRICLLAGAAFAGLVTGCITPSIPIPPPDPEDMTFVVSGEGADSSATFSYPANVNYRRAIVYVYNHDRGLGIIEASRPDGSVGPTRPVSAAIGDQIVVTFQVDDQAISTCIRLRNGQQSSTDYCSL